MSNIDLPNNKMRILFVVPFYKPAYLYGGPVNSLSMSCEALASMGEQVTVFTTNANGSSAIDLPVDRPVNVNGVHVYYFERHPLSPPKYFIAPKMRRTLLDQIGDFNVAYTSATWTYPMLAFSDARTRKQIPYVVSPRGDFMTWSMKQSYLKKLAYLTMIEKKHVDQASAIHCTSQAEIQQLKPWRFHPTAVLIPNGINTSPFKNLPKRGSLREQLHISDDAPVTLLAGRIHRMKRINRTIEVFFEVTKSVPNAQLIVAGHDEDGSAQDAQYQADKLGLNKNVHFIGLVTGTALLQAYRDADLLVLLSHRENFGMVVLEAMASKLPVLISREVGIGDAVTESDAGFVVNPDTPECASTWIRMLNNRQERKVMGQRAYQLVLDKFSIESTTLQMRDLLYKIS